jgi:hypothetical protein
MFERRQGQGDVHVGERAGMPTERGREGNARSIQNLLRYSCYPCYLTYEEGGSADESLTGASP